MLDFSVSTKTKRSKLVIVFMAMLLMALFVHQPIRIDNAQFVILSVVSICLIIIGCVIFEIDNVRLTLVDFYWVGFLLWSGFSVIWSENKSLAWNMFLIWTNFFIFYFAIKLVSQNNSIQKLIVKGVLFVAFLFYFQSFLFFIYSDGVEYYRWNKYFGANRNVIALFSVALVPYVFWCLPKGHLYGIFKWLILFSTIYMIFLTRAKGAIVCLGAISLITISFEKNVRWEKTALAVVSILIVISFYIVNTGFIDRPALFRWDQIALSFRLFIRDPILGVGLGNWIIEAYNTDLSNTSVLNDFNFTNYVGSHNVYTTMVAELGSVGIILFFGPIVLALKQFQNFRNFSPLEKASLLFLAIYFLSMAYYPASNSFSGYFSKFQLFAFFAFAILPVSGVLSVKFRGYIFSSLTFIAVLLVAWFSFLHCSHKRINLAKNADKTNSLKILELLESAYRPGIYTMTSDNRSIAFLLAKQYEKAKIFESADKFYQRALVDAPNDERVIIGAARYNLKYMCDLDYVYSMTLRLHKNHSKLTKANKLLAKVELLRGNYVEVRNSLNLINPFYYDKETKLIEASLYSGSYLSEIVTLNKAQKKKMADFREKYASKVGATTGVMNFVSSDIELNLNLFYSEMFAILSRDQAVKVLENKLWSFYYHRVHYGWAPMMQKPILSDNQKIQIVEILTDHGSKWNVLRMKRIEESDSEKSERSWALKKSLASCMDKTQLNAIAHLSIAKLLN